MRCEVCNVDVMESAQRCPLCGGSVTQVEPVLTGLQTAEYPPYLHRPYPRSKNLIALIIGAVFCTVFAWFDFARNQDLDWTQGCIIIAVLAWALLIRPVSMPEFWLENYLLYIGLLLMPLSIWLRNGFRLSFSAMQPSVGWNCAVLSAVLLLCAIFRKKERLHALRYALFITAIGVLQFLWAMASSVNTLRSAGVAGLLASLAYLAFLLCSEFKQAKDELRALFYR